jgi:hypothetical protein
MNRAPLSNWTHFDNILYIGEEAKTCIRIIEKFNSKLLEIEQDYAAWFTNQLAENKPARQDKLQYHIHYHFEGGIAAFKFKSEDNLPAIIRNECFNACKDLAAEQLQAVA